MKQKSISIIGGGIAGLTLAIALKKVGIESTIYEASSIIKPVGAGLGLGINAIKAFDVLGMKEKIQERGRILPAFTIYDEFGQQIIKTDNAALGGELGESNFTIHRAALHECLLNELGTENLELGKKLDQIEMINEQGVIMRFTDGTKTETNYLIAADGIHSPVRKQLLPRANPRYSGYTCWRSIIDDNQLNIKETSETWGRNGRFGIVPLADHQIYWFACINSPQNNEKVKNFKVNDLLKIFGNYHQPIPQILMQTKSEDLIWNNIYDLKPTNRFAFGNVLLIGDAAHATTPNMGQGACQAIEDAVILAKMMSFSNSYKEVFKDFEQRRIPRTMWVVNTSRNIGKIAQIQNPIASAVRNAIFRMTPPSVSLKQLKKLAKVDFPQTK